MRRRHNGIKRGARLANDASEAVLDRGPVEFKSRISSRPGDVMTIASREVIKIPPTMTIMGAIKTMMTYGLRKVPVADPGTNRLVGIITSVDLIDFLGGGERHNLVKKRYGGNLLAAINGDVREIMEVDVITLSDRQSLEDALNTMLIQNIGGLPIVDDRHRVVGIISESDFAYLIADVKTGKIVGDYMSRRVVTTPPDISIGEAAKTMVSNGFRRLPVIRDDVLLGIVTATDIVKYLGGGKAFDKLVTGHIQEALEPAIKTIMVPNVVTTTSDVDLGDAAKLMMDKKVGSLPVIDDGFLMGILTERDILRALRET
ncbi:MAG: CBS domain-containing protein [Methanocellales archaeon]|nr:CBS domain-containing protein [Methanocellales archaeon]